MPLAVSVVGIIIELGFTQRSTLMKRGVEMGGFEKIVCLFLNGVLGSLLSF